MIRNEKIIVFNGPKDEFDKYITQYYDSENCNDDTSSDSVKERHINMDED